MIILKILAILAGVYVLYKICFPDDYTEVDQIFDERKEMDKLEKEKKNVNSTKE